MPSYYFPVFNGYNGFLDKKRRRKKSKKKRGEEKQFPSSMTTTTMSRDMEARVYRWAPSRTRNVLSTVTVGLARKVSSTPVFRYAVRLSLSLSVLTFFFFHSNSFLCCFRRFFMALRWITITRNKPTGTENPQQE